MTFGDLLNDLRGRKLNDSSVTFYSDSGDLLPFLSQAERRIAGLFSIPRATASGTVAASATTIPTPTSFAEVAPGGLYVNGLKLRRVSVPEIEFYRLRSPGQPGFYAWSAMISGSSTILLAPQNDTTTRPYVLEFVRRLPTTRTTSDTPWENLFEEYQDAIVLLAAMFAYEKGQGDYQAAERWRVLARDRLTEFATFLRGNGYDVPLTSVEAALRPASAGS